MNNHKKIKNSILVCGAYGMGNIGDESILESIVKGIKELIPDAKFTIISRDPRETERLHNLNAIQTFDLPSIHKAMQESEVFISGGGSLIQNSTSNRSLYYYLYTLYAAKKRGCKVIMYGCGIGPVTGGLNRKTVSYVINKSVDEISLRDEKSYESLNSYGHILPPIKITADPAFNLSCKSLEAKDFKSKTLGIDEKTKYICFSLRNWKGFDKRIPDFSKAADYAYKKYNLYPIFFSINSNTDISAGQKVGSLMKSPFKIINGVNDYSTALLIMSESEAVISIRLHSLVFAASVGIKLGAISYDPKVKSFMEYFGNDNILDIDDINEANLRLLIDRALEQDSKANLDRAQQLRVLENENPKIVARSLNIFSENNSQKSPRKIAFFQSDFRVGGIQKSLVNVLENLDYSKYEVDVYYFDKDLFFELPKNSNLHFIKCNPYNYLSRIMPFRLQLALRKPILNKKYDIAIDFNSYRSECSVSAVKAEADKRIMWIHNDVKIKRQNELKYRILWFFFKAKYKYFDEFVAVSPGIVDSFIEETHTQKSQIRIIPNHIDTNEIKNKLNEKIDFSTNTDTINICSCGRLCHQKGYDLLLPDFAKALKSTPNLMLYLIGDGPDKEALQAMAKSISIYDRVIFLGNQKNPFAYENQMDAFVLTSRYEGQGMVLWEAKSVGLPIIISKNLEKYNPGINGTNDIADALARIKKLDTKKFNDLKEYNDEITASIDSLLC